MFSVPASIGYVWPASLSQTWLLAGFLCRIEEGVYQRSCFQSLASILCVATSPSVNTITYQYASDAAEGMANKESMKAVIFDGPFKVSVQDRPIPKCKYT
jgi:hypothetical protein